MSDNVLVMAGGTGGHVIPALTVAEVLRARGYQVHWLGAEQGIENRLVPAHNFPLHRLTISGVRGNGVMRKLMAPLKLVRAVYAACKIIRDIRPKLTVGFGGFASGPGGIASVISGVPLVIHEQNAVPGLTNRVLSKVARIVLQAFSGAFKGSAMTVGNPVRDAIVALPAPEQRYAAREGDLNILITGGSQGALALNCLLPAQLAKVVGDAAVNIRHQAGRGRVEEAERAYKAAQLNADVAEFIDDMAQAYGWADLIICRAGAATVCEVAAAGVAALFVPLPTAVDDHQTFNARWLSDEGAALLLPQSELESGALQKLLSEYFTRAQLQDVACRARSMAITDSAEKVAEICQEVIHGQ
ncbi:MAG: undecaprenyldiphospho-muramoylpentapeptide beta-N-acetylglucosaminyltransferase [Alcanivoracaceae bacterium]|nr:undecaprenyldiphospho-muramoylpentapeptide beta-N-acetylglucosaminyltransferase [Alcanivoracaceae bacterium]